MCCSDIWHSVFQTLGSGDNLVLENIFFAAQSTEKLVLEWTRDRVVIGEPSEATKLASEIDDVPEKQFNSIVLKNCFKKLQ